MNNATQYLQKLVGAMVSGKIKDLKKAQLTRIAAIITGLEIISNPKFHTVLRLTTADIENIKNNLQTKSVADKVATYGTRSPSMLANAERILTFWDTRPTETQTKFVNKVKQLATKLNNPIATQEDVPLPPPQQNLSKRPT